MRIELLGGLRIAEGGRTIVRFRTRKTACLLAYLAYHARAPHPREVLIDLFWPDADEERGHNNLSIALTSLRRQLEPPGTPPGAVLQADRYQVQLNPEAFETDVSEFLAALKRARSRRGQPGERADLERALELYPGEFLPGFYEDWVIDAQTELSLLHDEVRERIEEIGPAALPECVLLAESTASRAGQQRVALPPTFTRIFGRESEVGAIRELLAPAVPCHAARLLTLTGPGGIGKTRLAIEAARACEGHFAGGTWFVAMQGIREPKHVLRAIAQTLGMLEDLRTGPLDQVAEFLGGQYNPDRRNHSSLLVLDNLEHLLSNVPGKNEDASLFVRELLARCPNVSVLATSRRPLALEGEQEFPVEPLQVCACQAEGRPCGAEMCGAGSECRLPEAIARLPAAALFVDRAQLVQPDFQITVRNAEAVSAICRMLEGLPLAIELCAAAVQTATPAQMLKALNHRFDYLVSRRRDASDRHRSLRATVDWSYRLLSPELQAFFERLCVFQNDFSVEAVAAVCVSVAENATATARTERVALNFLTRLRECSLLRSMPSGEEMRFHMLETLREFGRERMSEATYSDQRNRHASYYASLTEEAERHLHGPNQVAWIERLALEWNNLSSAFDWALGAMPEAALRMASSLSLYWRMRGSMTTGRDWAERAIAAGEAGPAVLRANCLAEAGDLARLQGDYQTAVERCRLALSMLPVGADVSERANTLRRLGYAEWHLGLAEPSEWHIREAYELMRDRPSCAVKAMVAANRSAVSFFYGRPEEAQRYWMESFHEWEAIGDRWGMADSMHDRGYMIECIAGPNDALPYFTEALAVRREIGDVDGAAKTLNQMGHVLIEIGDADGARLAFEEALDCFRREGSRVMQAWCLYGLAEILRREGHLLEAAEMLSEVERLFLASGDPSILPNVWRRQADVAMDRADARAAASLYCKAGLNHAKQGDTGSHWSYLRELAGSELADGHARNAVSLCAAASRLRQECRLASDDRLDSFANELRTKLPQCDFEPLWRASEAIADEYSGQPATSAEAVA